MRNSHESTWNVGKKISKIWKMTNLQSGTWNMARKTGKGGK